MESMRWVRRVLDQYLGLGIGGLGLATIVGLLLSQRGDISKVLGELKGINQRLENHETWLTKHGQKIDALEDCKDATCPHHAATVATANEAKLEAKAATHSVHEHGAGREAPHLWQRQGG